MILISKTAELYSSCNMEKKSKSLSMAFRFIQQAGVGVGISFS